MKRVSECRYDDPTKKSYTQLLREKMAVLEVKLRDLETESAYSSQVLSPVPLSDSSGTSDGSFESEPMVNLSAEMHNALYVLHKDMLAYAPSDHSKVFKLSSDIIGNAVFTQTLADSTPHHPQQSFNAAHPTLPS
jgi:hypothetical protein